MPSESEMLTVARPLVAAGIAVHWLRRRDKAPIEDHWSTAPVHTIETLTAGYRAGANLGVRLGEQSKTAGGYLHLIDIDVRDPEQAEDAWAALLKLWPEAKSAPFVVSGSGGASQHRYFVTDKPFRSKKLAYSAGFKMVFDPKKDREVKKRDWEIELFGTSKQAVLPPSLHPDTGNNYTWGAPLQIDLLELGIGPILSSEIVSGWGVSSDDISIDEDDDLFSLVRAEPMGLSEAEITAAVAGVPPEWVEDRDCWLQMGQALHHEYQGGAPGFERWCEWSRQSGKFDIQDQKRVWQSFREQRRKPVRMASIIKAAGDYRLAEAHADLEALLGGGDDAEPASTSTALTIVPAAGVDADLMDLLGAVPPVVPVRPTPRPAVIVDPEWQSHLHRNGEGVLKKSLHNVRLILRNDIRLRGVIAANRFTQEPVMIAEPRRASRGRERPKQMVQLDGHVWKLTDPINGTLWSDDHDASVRAMIEAPESQGGYGITVSDRDMKAAVSVVAHENGFHPVKDYLEASAWDGIPRAETLFVDYVGSPDDAYHREAGLLWLIGAVARIYEPGHKFDFVPILEGIQGKRKSTFFITLGRHWSAELAGDFHDKKAMVEQMQGAWIIEMPELQGFSKSEVQTIKGFISRQKDKVRLSYGRRAAEFLRQCVFGGTTNEDEYLRDASGGRRFWPIECRVDEIDIVRLTENVDQIWAEALHLYRTWRQRYPTAQLPLYMKNESSAMIASAMQESRRQIGADEVMAGQIEDWLSKPIGADLGLDDLECGELEYRTRTCLLEIWVHMLGKDAAVYTDRDQQLLGRAMRKVQGWRVSGARHRFEGGIGQQRAYEKVFYVD